MCGGLGASTNSADATLYLNLHFASLRSSWAGNDAKIGGFMPQSGNQKPKDEEEIKDIRVTARFNKQEYEKLVKGKPEKMSNSEWLRHKAITRKLPRQIPEVNRQLWGELAKAVGNLNQLAKKINQGVSSEISKEEIQETKELVQALRQDLIGFDRR